MLGSAPSDVRAADQKTDRCDKRSSNKCDGERTAAAIVPAAKPAAAVSPRTAQDTRIGTMRLRNTVGLYACRVLLQLSEPVVVSSTGNFGRRRASDASAKVNQYTLLPCFADKHRTIVSNTLWKQTAKGLNAHFVCTEAAGLSYICDSVIVE